MSQRARIVLTGGGTAGHVMPHIAMLKDYHAAAYEVHYVGSSGIEKTLMAGQNIEFHQILAGKLRRYFSVQNFFDIFKVVAGLLQSLWILLRLKPAFIFSKGGFVSVPVAVSAWLLRIPVYSHESDLTPGLANRLIKPFATRIFYSFPETSRYLAGDNSKLVGLPVRRELHEGSRARGAAFCQFEPDCPTILVMGGSLGAQRINDALKVILPELIKRFQVIHITGKGKAIDYEHHRYRSYEFIGDELKDLFQLSDLVVSRAGANSIFEFLALRKPMLLVPLEIGSRGDQVDNAKSFAERGLARVLRETDLSPDKLLSEIDFMVENLDKMKQSLVGSGLPDDPASVILNDLRLG